MKTSTGSAHRVAASISNALYWFLPLTGRILAIGSFQVLTFTQVDNVQSEINSIR